MSNRIYFRCSCYLTFHDYVFDDDNDHGGEETLPPGSCPLRITHHSSNHFSASFAEINPDQNLCVIIKSLNYFKNRCIFYLESKSSFHIDIHSQVFTDVKGVWIKLEISVEFLTLT